MSLKQYKRELYTILSKMDSVSEVGHLLEDIMSPNEVDELARRIQILKRLLEGKSQRDIAEDLGVSLATISRGSRVMQHGSGAARRYLSRK